MELIVQILGWAVWVLAAALWLVLIMIFSERTREQRAKDPGPFWFGFVLCLGLLATLVLPISKFHLLWFFPLSRFPYAVIYKENSTMIWILAVAHGHRRPGYWKERL